jgi:hypothetical protein
MMDMAIGIKAINGETLPPFINEWFNRCTSVAVRPLTDARLRPRIM